MRTAVVSVLLILFSFTLSAQGISVFSVNNGKGDIIKVSADTLNLGEIYLDDLSTEHGIILIKLTNSGRQPLLIRNVTGCCGTNIKSWPKAPIIPGKQSDIRVEFRIEPKPQRISRTVTIESNAQGKPVVKLHIVGVVIQRRQPNELVL
ncbi:MAG: DUF1573 domain-containing protein [Bacteroidota bacterium]